jgi:small subunit ribosomal protein YMR-31
MFATRVLRQAAQHAERTPSIKFIGKRTVPASVDHTPQPHPASPTHSLPTSFTQSSHSTFSSYRDHAQQFGPLRKTISSANAGIGGQAGSELGPVSPPKGFFFDRNELPARFHRAPLSLDEIEAVETGGAAAFA